MSARRRNGVQYDPRVPPRPPSAACSVAASRRVGASRSLRARVVAVARGPGTGASPPPRATAAGRRTRRRRHRRAALRALRLRRSRCCRPARARRGLDRLARAGARLARARPGRLVARRPRRHAGDPARGQPRPRRRSTSPCRRRARITTSRAIPSRSSGRATAGCSRPGSTRIDGLVSLADIAPTAKAIAAGEKPPIRVARSDATQPRHSPGSTCG